MKDQKQEITELKERLPFTGNVLGDRVKNLGSKSECILENMQEINKCLPNTDYILKKSQGVKKD